jgi:succinate dehydrogenase flavin-adding protein (antitoxin of CptAB toxin-antitoxin module)
MTNVSELNTQNAKIKELSSVLQYLISNKEICNTQVTCDLFLDYAEQVTNHLYLEEKDVYRYLLNHTDKQVRNTTHDFFSGSIEIKRVFNEYLGRWCRNKKLRVIKHAEFLQDSKEIFELVLNRIHAETTILYPMIEEILDEKVAA